MHWITSRAVKSSDGLAGVERRVMSVLLLTLRESLLVRIDALVRIFYNVCMYINKYMITPVVQMIYLFYLTKPSTTSTSTTCLCARGVWWCKRRTSHASMHACVLERFCDCVLVRLSACVLVCLCDRACVCACVLVRFCACPLLCLCANVFVRL